MRFRPFGALAVAMVMCLSGPAFADVVDTPCELTTSLDREGVGVVVLLCADVGVVAFAGELVGRAVVEVGVLATDLKRALAPVFAEPHPGYRFVRELPVARLVPMWRSGSPYRVHVDWRPLSNHGHRRV